MAIQRERKFIYSEKNISFEDIAILAFRSINPQQVKHVKSAVLLINELIKRGGKLKIEEAAKIADYDYNNSQDKYWFKNSFFNPLFNLGLIVEDYDIKDGIILKTYIKLDNAFFKLLDNFKIKWEKGVLKYKK